MIRVNDISFSYRPNVPVLRNITMRLEEGKIYGLLGENGVGKTTLLTLLCGLKKPQGSHPSLRGSLTTKGNTFSGAAGTIEVDGHDPYRREPSLLENQYYLSDEVAPVRLTPTEYAKTYGKFWSKFDMGKFTELMNLFENDLNHRMDRMSAGQLKKTYICFALATNAKYLYMDEPTNGLDIPSKAQFRKAITLYTAENSTRVISTHQVRDLENIIDPIIILDRQDVLLNASIEEISRKLYFDYSNVASPGALYSEMVVGGSIQVYPNLTGEESKVNVEALFNTVHLHKDLIKGMFAPSAHLQTPAASTGDNNQFQK